MGIQIKSLMGFIMFIMFSITISVQAKPVVLASIKPLALIAYEIAGVGAEVDTLLPVSASPHDYPLKMSDYTRIKKADLVLWIGPELESFLEKPINNLPSGRVINIYNLSDIYWPSHASETRKEHHHARDPHLWLDPRNAVVIARALSAHLIQIDPKNKIMYMDNMYLFAKKMEELDKSLAARLSPFSNVGFAVYHEGYRHFVSHYALRQLDYVTFTPEQRPGAKHLQQLRKLLAKEGNCLFLEPYNDHQSMRDLAKELKLNIGILDALGQQAGNDQYSQLLERIADAFVACLKAEPR